MRKYFSQRRQEKREAQTLKRTDYSEVCGSWRSESQRLQRSRLCPFEEPAGADAQAVMPRWQSRRVHREPRLPREWPSHHFSARQDRGVLCPQTDRLSELREMLALEFVTCEECADVARAKMRLLERQLRGAC